MALRNRPAPKVFRGKDGKVQGPYVKCEKCSQRYITDINRIHRVDGIQFINFVATEQFIRIADKDSLYAGDYLCVDQKNCDKRKAEEEYHRAMALVENKKKTSYDRYRPKISFSSSSYF